MENFEIEDFTNNPLLRQLLTSYCLITYEENSIIDDEHLIREYNYLKKENLLNDLFECEMLNNGSENAV